MATENDAAYRVSESLHWATAPPDGQGLHSIGKDRFNLARQGWEGFFSPWYFHVFLFYADFLTGLSRNVVILLQGV